VPTLCERLNAGAAGAVDALALEGSRLALELLLEGVPLPGSGTHHRLLSCAMELLRLPAEAVHERLASLYVPDLHDAFCDALGRATGTGAWATLLELLEERVVVLEPVADSLWARERRPVATLSACPRALTSDWARRRLAEILPSEKPWAIARIRIGDDIGLPDWGRAAMTLVSSPNNGGFRARVDLGGDAVLMLEQRAFPASRSAEVAAIASLPAPDPSWAPLREGVHMMNDPSPAALASALERLAVTWVATDGLLLNRLPWQLEACLLSRMSLGVLAARARTGRLGTRETWEAAERRWKSETLAKKDILSMSRERWPFDEGIDTSGLPLVGLVPSFLGPDDNVMLEALLRLRAAAKGPARASIAEWILHLLANAGLNHRFVSVDMPPSLLFSLLLETDRRVVANCVFSAFFWPTRLSSEWTNFFDQLGRIETHFQYYSVSRSQPLATSLGEAFVQDPRREGLLYMLAVSSLEGSRVEIPVQIVEPWFDAGERSADAAVAVRVACGFVDCGEGRRFGRRVAGLCSTSDRVLATLLRAALVQKVSVELASALLEGVLDGAEADRRPQVEAAAADLLRKMKSAERGASEGNSNVPWLVGEEDNE